MINVFVAIAALYFTVLMSSLSADSWQKLVPPGVTKPSRQNPGMGRLFHVSSTQCTASPVTFPSGLVGGQGQALSCVPVRANAIPKVKQAAWARCRGELLHFIRKPGGIGKKTGNSKILGCTCSSYASQVPQSCTKPKAI